MFRIFTPVWGDKFINLFERALVRSFLWEKNHEALKDARWSLLIHKSEFEKVLSIATKVIPEDRIDTIEIDSPINQLTSDRGSIMCQGVVSVMDKCLKDGSAMFMATPDVIWGDGAIRNIRRAGLEKGTCVTFPHMRVLPSILDQIDFMPQPISNFKLATLAMANPHKSWTSSEHGVDPSGVHIGGIFWKKMGKGLVSLIHRMPSPYFINVLPEDKAFFMADGPEHKAAFGAWDHNWSAHLVSAGRFRMILSSDSGFMAEVTSPNENVPPTKPINPHEPDSFALNHLHNQINRQFIATFRYHEP